MRTVLAALVFLICSQIAYAGLGEGDIACRSGGNDNQAFKRKLWDGYEISLGPARNAEQTEYPCTGAIYNVAGKVVFRTNGFGVIFDDLTGEDLDGDGKPDVVFQTDKAGGAQCCWIYNVVSLSPKPHHLFDIGNGDGVGFRKDKQGKWTFWTTEQGPYKWTNGVYKPSAEKVLRALNGNLIDMTPEFCGEILSTSHGEYLWDEKVLTVDSLKKLSSGIERPDEEVARALLSRALQDVFCHKFDEAEKELELWPEKTREQMKGDFADSIRNDYPEFAKRLEAGK